MKPLHNNQCLLGFCNLFWLKMMFVGLRKFHTPPIPRSYSTPTMTTLNAKKRRRGISFTCENFVSEEQLNQKKGFYKQTSLNLCSNMTAKIKSICNLSNFISRLTSTPLICETQVTLRGVYVVEFLWTVKLKKGIKNLSSVPVNVLRKTRIGTNFSRRRRAIKFDGPCKVVVLVVNPTRYRFTFSLPLSTLFCLKSLVTFRKCKVALLMATLHSCKLSWCWTLLRMIIHQGPRSKVKSGRADN